MTLLDLRRAGKNRASMRASAREVEVKPVHPVQRPRFDAETFVARRETEMQNGVRLQRFFKLLKSWPHNDFSYHVGRQSHKPQYGTGRRLLVGSRAVLIHCPGLLEASEVRLVVNRWRSREARSAWYLCGT